MIGLLKALLTNCVSVAKMKGVPQQMNMKNVKVTIIEAITSLSCEILGIPLVFSKQVKITSAIIPRAKSFFKTKS